MLYEIYKPHCKVLGILQRLGALFGSHLYQVDIIVVPFNGPVYHILIVGQFAVSNHHIFRPYSVWLFRSNAYRIRTCACKFFRVVSFGSGDSDIFSVVLQYSHVSQVLHYVVGAIGRNVFVRIVFTFHTDIVFYELLGDVSKLSGVYKNLCLDAHLCTVLLFGYYLPSFGSLFNRLAGCFSPYFKKLFFYFR